MKPSVYMEEMDAFTYRDKLEGDSIFFIPVGALEQHGSRTYQDHGRRNR